VVHPNDVKREDPWDLYINLNDAYETNITAHYVDAYLYRAFGTAEGIDKSVSLVSTTEEIENVNDAIKDINGDYIVVHMRQWAWENKNISPETWTMIMAWMEAMCPDIKMISVGAQYDMKMPANAGPQYIDLVDQLENDSESKKNDLTSSNKNDRQ
jgi:hypothetical protein